MSILSLSLSFSLTTLKIILNLILQLCLSFDGEDYVIYLTVVLTSNN